jgi:hypothetical protein
LQLAVAAGSTRSSSVPLRGWWKPWTAATTAGATAAQCSMTATSAPCWAAQRRAPSISSASTSEGAPAAAFAAWLRDEVRHDREHAPALLPFARDVRTRVPPRERGLRQPVPAADPRAPDAHGARVEGARDPDVRRSRAGDERRTL